MTVFANAAGILDGTPGDDTINGGSGSDVLVGRAGADTLNGGDGDDTLYAGDLSLPWSVPGTDYPTYAYSPPILDRGADVDTLNGGAGLDLIFAGYGDKIDGGADKADLLLSLAGGGLGVTIDFRNLDNGGALTVAGGLIQNIRSVLWIEGTNFADTITGSDQGTPAGLQSAPIFGLGGNDHLIAGANTGNIYGGDGSDTIESTYSNHVYFGDDGDDTITVNNAFGRSSAYGGNGNDTISLVGYAWGGPGNDVISAPPGGYIDLYAVGGPGDDSITGGSANDILVGGDGADVISGYYGDDVLFSAGTDQAALYDWREYVDTGTEHDILDGGPGGNTFYAGYGDDVLGGSDNDWLSLSLIGAPSGITLNVADLDSTYEPVHFAGGQISRIHGIFELFGSNFSDTLTLTGGMRVYGMGGDDVINGDAQDDEILGGDGNDTLRGDAGIDTLTGNSGDDTFRDTAAGLNGDTITDLTSADKIIITDATLAGFTADLSGHTLTFSGGTLTIANVASARVVASAAVGGGVQLMIVHPPHNDFNGDGKSDILWRGDDGTMRDWLGQSGGTFVGNKAHFDVNPGSFWHVAGTGDFNGDGRLDILWRGDDGTMRNWLGQPDGSFVGNIAHFNANPGLSWHVVGTGDFNGDGKTDVLWQNDDGTMRNWLGQADGNLIGNAAHFNANPGTSWHVAGTGDFNGDGLTDVFWRNDSGLVTEWLGQPDGNLVGHPLNVNPGTSWHVVGTGDFNGDGRDDILWRNDDGTMRDWIAQTDGTFVGNAAHFDANPGADWHVVGIGDYNGDAIDDLLFQNSSGQVAEWVGQADGSFAVNANVNTNPGLTWHVQDPFVHDPFA